jgi:hypothetical protein
MVWDEAEVGFRWQGPYIPDFISVEVIGNIHENPELVQQ